MEKPLNHQVGGSHYKSLPFQPVELFALTPCTPFQANIWKYIARHRHKDGKKDIEKCMHYAKLAIDLSCDGHFSSEDFELVRDFCRRNGLSSFEALAIEAAAENDYAKVIAACESIIELEYS